MPILGFKRKVMGQSDSLTGPHFLYTTGSQFDLGSPPPKRTKVGRLRRCLRRRTACFVEFRGYEWITNKKMADEFAASLIASSLQLLKLPQSNYCGPYLPVQQHFLYERRNLGLRAAY